MKLLILSQADLSYEELKTWLSARHTGIGILRVETEGAWMRALRKETIDLAIIRWTNHLSMPEALLSTPSSLRKIIWLPEGHETLQVHRAMKANDTITSHPNTWTILENCLAELQTPLASPIISIPDLIHGLAESLFDGVALLDQEFTIRWVNVAFSHFVNQPGPQLMGQPFEQSIASIHQSAWKSATIVARESKGFKNTFQFFCPVRERKLYGNVVLQRIENPMWQELCPTATWIVTVRDTTVEQLALEEERLRADRYETANRASHGAFWDWHCETGDLVVSTHFRQLLCLPLGSGLSLADLAACIEPSERGRFWQQMTQVSGGDLPELDSEFPFVLANGQELSVQIRGIPRPDSTGKIYRVLGSLKDVTNERLAQQQARYHQEHTLQLLRLEILGDFAKTLAHDLNQPLAAMVNFAATLRSMADAPDLDPHTIGKLADEIQEQGLHAGAMLRRLRDHLRNGATKIERVELGALAAQTRTFLIEEFYRSSVQVEIEQPESIPLVIGNRLQLQYAITQLLRNAKEASDSLPIQERRITLQITPANNNQEVEIGVIDRGKGVLPGVRERIFEPFFSTKPSGMGLGLSMARTIAEGHGGRLRYESLAPHGSAFYLILPTTRNPQVGSLANQRPDEKPMDDSLAALATGDQ